MFGISEITRLSEGRTRLFTAENVFGLAGRGGMAELIETPQKEVTDIGQLWTGSNSCARELGVKWKVRPCITLPAESVTTILDTDGSGRLTHIWITLDQSLFRDIVIRIYWDNEATPSVESPVGDFFCCGWNKALRITSLPVNVNPTGGMNCFFPMPFRKHARITIENRRPHLIEGFFYAVSMDEGPVYDDEAYFHAKFNRTNPVKYGDDYIIADDITGRGHYVGTHLSWQQNNSGWWGEGEVKAFIDDDKDFPSYCGTGTEDYFGGAWGFNGNFTAPYLGYQDLSAEEGRPTNSLGNRHSMYRFHICDPIKFNNNFKITIQTIGWRSEGRYLPLQDDLSSVAYWYQAEPHAEFKPLGNRNMLEVI